MMMGGAVKGGYGHMHAAYNGGGGGGGRRRWNAYVLMVIMPLVFGCAILGVMGIQRLKDRQVLDQLIKEKDARILSLHLLLQKERAHVQEVQKKTEEMNVKLYNLRTQKTQLNNRLLEMQSTISSLKEEQRTIELAFQEKQNKAKLLGERYIAIKDQNPQVKALTETLQQKEAEIEDLKHHIHLPASTDEASSVPSNIMAKANVSWSQISVLESATQSEEQRENGTTKVEGRREFTRNEKFDAQENSKRRIAENGVTDLERQNEQVEPKDKYDPQYGRMSEMNQEKNRHETEKIKDLGNEDDQKPRAKDSEELAKMGDAHSRKISMPQGSDSQELGLHKVRLRGKYGYLRRANGKRWRPIPNSQRLVDLAEENGNKLQKPRNQRKIQNSIMGLRMQNESALKNQQFGVEDKLPEAGQVNVKAYIRDYNEENNGENSEDSPPGIMLRNGTERVDTDDKSHTNSSSMKSHVSQAEMPKYLITNSEESGLSRKAMIQHREEDRQSKEGDDIPEHKEIKNDDSQQTEDDETTEDSDNTQVENFDETEFGTITSTKSARNSEEDEETDETEF